MTSWLKLTLMLWGGFQARSASSDLEQVCSKVVHGNENSINLSVETFGETQTIAGFNSAGGLDYEDKETEIPKNQEAIYGSESNEWIHCNDNHELCNFWAVAGECVNSPAFMTKNCMKSCLLCAYEMPGL